MYIDESRPKSKSRERKSKKTRNNYVKTSRTKNDLALYEEQFSSIKRTKRDRSKKIAKKRRQSKLKINIKENHAPQELIPQSAQGSLPTESLMQNYTFQDNLKHQRHNLIERMNRIENIITSGKSYDRAQEEKLEPFCPQNDYIYDYSKDYTPYTKRAAISPIPSYRMST